MGDDIFLIAGLGNPGSKYDYTRHNIGFMVIDKVAKEYNFILATEKWDAKYTRERLWGSQICFVTPMTFMNLSGKAIARFMSFYKLSLDKLIVIHDDLDMNTGRLKLVKGGGPGGHNGIRSLIQALGTKDFYRFKIGIGRPGQAGVHSDFPVDKYVLTQFENHDLQVIDARYDSIIQGLQRYVKDGPEKAMNYINSFK